MKGTVLAGLVLTLSIGLASVSVNAAVFYNRRQALELAFPEADKILTRTVFIKPEQLKRIQRLAHAPMESQMLSFYVGYKGERLLGYAFIDAHVVRTQPETFLTVLTPQGRVKMVQILAFHEPPEYMPPPRWLQQFSGRELTPGLRLKADIQGITGATMSARAITYGVRKILAIYQVVLKED